MTTPKHQRCFSLSLVIFTVICWAYQSTLVNLTKKFDAAWTLWFIVGSSFVVFSIILAITRHSPLGPKTAPLKNAPLGDAVTLWDMDVIWTAVLFSVIERKCLSRVHWCCICLAIAGIVLVCQPEFIFQQGDSHAYDGYPNLTLGYITAFLAAMCFTFMFVFVAKLQEWGVHWSAIEFNFGPIGLMVLPFFTWGVNGWTLPKDVTAQDWVAVFVVASLDILARLCATFALQVESPPLVALTATLEIPFSYLFAFIFIGEVPSYLSAIGAGLIFLAVIIMGVKDLMATFSQDGDDATQAQSDNVNEQTTLIPDGAAPSRGRRNSTTLAGRKGIKSPIPT